MKKHVQIKDLFPKHLFWDMNPDVLDPKRDKDIIIPRALFATTPSTFPRDISNLEQLYSKREIVLELSRTKERISNQVCKLVSQRYHVPTFTRFSK